MSEAYFAAIIFPISMAIALFALVVAFNERLRNLVVDAMKNVLDFILRALGINKSRSQRRRQKKRMRRRQQQHIESGI